MSFTCARMVAAASTMASVAVAVTSVGFGVAKATTKLAFSTARGIASVAPIPLLDASLIHLEKLSLFPILLGESIACTSLIAASTSLDLLSSLFESEDEASFSLATFVALVRREWAEHEAAGRSITEVARAVAAWAAIQGFTKQWSEDRWLKSVRELTPEDFRPPDRHAQGQRKLAHRRTISRVSITDDVILFGRSGQVISADIGEKENINDSSYVDLSQSSRRCNYETRKTLRRLSKMVLAGYGGAGLLFFGVPLRPDKPASASSQSLASNRHKLQRSDNEVKDSEEKILVHVVEDAEAEALLGNVGFSEEESHVAADENLSPRPPVVNPDSEPSLSVPSSVYSWWNVLLGKHDREIFEGFAFTPADESDRASIRPSLPRASSFPSQGHSRFSSSRSENSLFDMPTHSPWDSLRSRKVSQPQTATVGDLSNMPRFWVLTDHGRRQVVLVIRGTMSYNDLAADLHCEPEVFEPPASTSTSTTHSRAPKTRTVDDSLSAPQQGTTYKSSIPFPMEDDAEDMAGFKSSPSRPNRMSHGSASNSGHARRTSIFDVAVEPSQPWPPRREHIDNENSNSLYQVHSGILKLARTMGSPGKPVHEAVCTALSRNRDYELVLCGHSLGAGVASLLALMWADPQTCCTVSSSGLPADRRISVYCFAPPCVTSPALSLLCKNLITSIVYSFDVVSRLSLGSVRDLNKAAYWLCEGQGEESASSVLRHALRGKIGFIRGTPNDTEEDKRWFIALRKTLEANMHFARLFPPGRVWWAIRDEALHPSHQRRQDNKHGIRLFEVLEVEHVFQQMEFKGDMLSSHLPHQYDRMLTELDILE